MKIVCFYGDNPLASWSLSRGLPSVLRRMGHEVIEIPTLGTSQVKRSDAERINKPITPDVDLILVSGPEYLMTWIKTFYPQWKSLNIPKACWYHESETREDRVADFSAIVPWFDFNFMPNKEDAERYGADHLIVGVDTEVFHQSEPDPLMRSCPIQPERTIDAAFIGTIYGKRKKFLDELQPLLKPGTKLTIGNSFVQDVEGLNLVKSVQLLASDYRRIKILVNLPTLSKVLVSKVLEAAACGCLVLTDIPKYVDIGVGYENPQDLASKLAFYKNYSTEEAISFDCAAIHREHRLDQRLEVILSKVNGKSHPVGQPQLAAV